MDGGWTDPSRQLAELERLVDGGTWVYDVASATVVWSPGLCRIFGVDHQTFVGNYRNWFRMVHPDDREFVGFTLGEAIDRLGDYTVEHRFIRASDGAERWARINGAIEAGPDGKAVRGIGATVDITDERRAARLVQEFLTNAAHELRTPAAAIAQAVHALQGELSDDDRLVVLQALGRQATRLRTLTSNLIDLGKIEVGPTHVVIDAVDLRAVLDDAVASAPPPHDRLLDTTAVPAGLRVRADPAHLERVLVNLLVNAWRYGGPNVEVRGAGVDGKVEITVADDGEGVAESVRPVLFEPFRRGPQRHPEASGLGLAIVHGLVRRMGGAVDYRPGNPGATFVVTLDAG